MIPVDIDNFIFNGINYISKGMIKIIGKYNKIPKEVGNCYSLKYVLLVNSQIVDISALSNCSSLKFLNLGYNQIVDISALSNCYSLKSLYLDDNQIVDISALSNCSSLETLFVRYNKFCKRHNFNSNIKVYY